MNIQKEIRINSLIALSVGAFLLICFVTLPFYRYSINPDGVAYLSIAEKYSHGDFGDALNGYWGPLISWLLAPIFWINMNPLLGARLLLIVSGVLSLILAYALLKMFNIMHWVCVTFFLCFVPLLAYWTMALAITPDSLLLTVFLLYVFIWMRSDWRYQSVLLGVVAALGYYTKAFFIVFFALHIVVTYVLSRLLHKKTDVRKLLITLGTAFVIILPWIISISLKYNQPTFSTTSTFVYKIFNPANPQGFPTDYVGLVEPPNDTAVSAWEDPAYLPLEDWNPLSSRQGITVITRMVRDNIRRIGDVLLELSVFSIATLAFLVVYLFVRPKKIAEQEIVLASTTIAYLIGMAIALVEYRYMLPVLAGLLIWSAYAAKRIRWKKYPRWVPLITGGIIVFSIGVMPLTQLYSRRHEQAQLYGQVQALKAYISPADRIASDDFDTIRHCYLLDAKCYGKINPAFNNDMNYHQLKEHDISIIILRKSDQPKLYMRDFQEVARTGNILILKK